MKKIIIIVSVVCVIGLGLGVLYAVDMDRMKKNEPVFFSTWGYDYAPPEKDTPLKAFERIEVGTKRSEIIKSFGEPDGSLSGLWGDIYLVENKRIVILYVGNDLNDAVVDGIKFIDIDSKGEIEDENNDVLEFNTPILIKSNGERVEPFIHLRWSEQWSDGAWINADGTNLASDLPTICDNLPIITYDEDFQILYKDQYVTLMGVTIYNEKFECIHNNKEATILEEVAEGTYYVSFVVKQQGKYIEVDDKYEMISNDCLYKFIKSSKENAEEIENNDFTLKFYDKQPETDKKLKFIINKFETDKYDYNVYSYQGNVNIVIDGNEMILRDALLKNIITIDDIIEKANNDANRADDQTDPHLTFPIVTQYKDGGTTVYAYKEYTIIKMNTLDGDRDVYIGTTDMTLSKINEYKRGGNGLAYEE